MRNLAIGTWASIGESCPVRCDVDGSGLAHLVIGEDDHSLELSFDAECLRKLAEASHRAVAEMDVLFEQEERRRARLHRNPPPHPKTMPTARNWGRSCRGSNGS